MGLFHAVSVLAGIRSRRHHLWRVLPLPWLLLLLLLPPADEVAMLRGRLEQPRQLRLVLLSQRRHQLLLLLVRRSELPK